MTTRKQNGLDVGDRDIGWSVYEHILWKYLCLKTLDQKAFTTKEALQSDLQTVVSWGCQLTSFVMLFCAYSVGHPWWSVRRLGQDSPARVSPCQGQPGTCFWWASSLPTAETIAESSAWHRWFPQGKDSSSFAQGFCLLCLSAQHAPVITVNSTPSNLRDSSTV